MERKFFIGLLTVMLFVVLAESSSMGAVKHELTEFFLRGSILEMNDDTATVCIGRDDGAKVGQVLTVYKFEKKEKQTETGGGPFKKIETGKIKITKILDDHMSNAKVISGEAKEGYIIELKMKK